MHGNFVVHDRSWALTSDSAASTHGVPVLIDDRGNAYGPDDIAEAGDGWQWTAGAIAMYGCDADPDNAGLRDAYHAFRSLRSTPSK